MNTIVRYMSFKLDCSLTKAFGSTVLLLLLLLLIIRLTHLHFANAKVHFEVMALGHCKNETINYS